MLSTAALLLAFAAQDPAPPRVDWGELMRRFQSDAAALQKSGTTLDLSALKREKLDGGGLAREIGRRESAFFGESWYEVLWTLSRAFGLQVEATADAFAVTFVRVSSGAFVATYLPARKSIVIDEARYAQDASFDRAML